MINMLICPQPSDMLSGVDKLAEMLILTGYANDISGKGRLKDVVEEIIKFITLPDNMNRRLDPVLQYEYLLEKNKQQYQEGVGRKAKTFFYW